MAVRLCLHIAIRLNIERAYSSRREAAHVLAFSKAISRDASSRERRQFFFLSSSFSFSDDFQARDWWSQPAQKTWFVASFNFMPRTTSTVLLFVQNIYKRDLIFLSIILWLSYQSTKRDGAGGACQAIA